MVLARHPACAAGAFSALPEGRAGPHRQAARRPGARRPADVRDGAAADAISTRPRRPEGRARSQAGRVPLAAPRIARRLVRAGTAHADAGVGKAIDENVAVATAIGRAAGGHRPGPRAASAPRTVSVSDTLRESD